MFASKLLEILFWFCLQIIAQCCTHLTHFVVNSICLLWINLILFYNCQLESYVLLILFGDRIRFIRFKIQRSCFRSELFVRKLLLFWSTYTLSQGACSFPGHWTLDSVPLPGLHSSSLCPRPLPGASLHGIMPPDIVASHHIQFRLWTHFCFLSLVVKKVWQ